MMMVRHAAERGKTRTSWLDSNHTFSFNRYFDPRYNGFRDLLVINEDFVRPGEGFGTHSHENMEILSYVVDGALEHRDSSGGSGVIRPNEFQRMTAGSGVSHSEFNASRTAPVHFLQIWILPDTQGLKPGYEQRSFPPDERRGRLRLMASADGANGSVKIHQDVRVSDGLLAAGEKMSYRLEPHRHAWVQVIKGSVELNRTPLQTSDGAAISEETVLDIEAKDESEILLFDLR